MKCSKWRKKYLKVSEIEMSKIKFPSAVYNILSKSQVKIIAIASLIKSNTDSDMHAFGRPIKKAPLLNSAQSWKLWQVYYGSHLQLKVHSSAFEILAPGHKSGTWSVEGKGGRQRWRSANSALAAFRKQPRVHRIVMDYVQGLKSGSRAKMSWQRAGGREGAENGFHVTLTAAISWIWLLGAAAASVSIM